MQDENPEDLLHERDAAKILNLSVYWLRRKRWEGSGPPYVKLGRAVRYKRGALRQWINDHQIGDASERDRKTA
jgi:predicted DNA-binding transcriptional regulator AlpA